MEHVQGLGKEASERDLVDQQTPVDPFDEEVEVQPLAAARDEVSEADWVDQQLPVPLDDDDAEGAGLPDD